MLKIKQKGLVDTPNIFNLIKKSDLSIKLATLATKAKLQAEQDQIVKLKAFESSYFGGKSRFEDHEKQHYLLFQPAYRYFKTVAKTKLK